MRCGKAKCCGQLIGWAAPGTQVKCPACGKLVRAGPLRDVPEIGKPVAQNSGITAKEWRKRAEQKEGAGTTGR